MNVDYDIAQWIKLAETDLGVARHLFEAYRPMPIETICYHSQQSAEKMVKGFLFSNGVEAPRIHDIKELCEMCIEIEAGFDSLTKEAITLSQYGVLPRYPNELELDEHDAETAIKFADKIMEFVNGLLSQPTEDKITTEKENPADEQRD